MLNYSQEKSKEDFHELQICYYISAHSDNDKDISLHYTLIASSCIFLTITATLGNILILVSPSQGYISSSAIKNTASFSGNHPITDLRVGVIGQPLTVVVSFSALSKSWSICRVTLMLTNVFNAIFSCVSLVTSSAISVDRLLALLLRLRYRQIVTVGRVRVAVVLFWLVSTSLISSLHFTSIVLYHIIGVAWMLLPLLVSTYSYTRIFFTIRRQQMQVQDSHGFQTGSSGLNMARYKKTIFNALWVHLTLLTCYLPFAVVMAVIIVHGLSFFLTLAQEWTLTLVYLNSSLNLVLYCWKIKEVRQAKKETVRQCCARFST